jgi:urea transport system substrate-binding protein
MSAAYSNVHLWAQAVRAVGTVEPGAVLRVVRGQRRPAPESTVYIDEESLHTWKKARIGCIRADGQVDIIWASEALMRPMPYSPYRTRREWHDLLDRLYRGWGESWACPVEPDSPGSFWFGDFAVPRQVSVAQAGRHRA